MIKLGFIGLGFVAQQCHLPSFQGLEDCELYAASDLHHDLMDRVSTRFEIPIRYSNYLDLLSDPKVDAVVITTPRHLTTKLCIDAINAGKKVFTEKPISLSRHSARALFELSISKNLPVQVGYMRRFDAATSYVEKILRSALNDDKLIMVRAKCYMGDSYASPFGDIKISQALRLSPINVEDKSRTSSQTFEFYLNVFSHTLDLISYLSNEKLVFNTKVLDEFGQGFTIFKGEKTECPVELATMKSNLNQWVETISFIFNNKTIDLHLNAAFLKNVPGSVVIREGGTDDITTTIRPKWSWAFRNQAINFIEICRNWPNAKDNLMSSVEQVELVEKIFEDKSI
jgi:predicted dehydrogenase